MNRLKRSQSAWGHENSASGPPSLAWRVGIGILPGEAADEGNPHLTIALPTGMGEARNVIVVKAGEAVIAIGGGLGTLSEIAHALRLGKLVVAMGSWRAVSPEGGDLPVIQATTAQQAVALALGIQG